MNDIYIKKTDVNKWIGKHFEKQDLISVEDLLTVIEELDDKVNNLKDELARVMGKDDWDNYEYGEF